LLGRDGDARAAADLLQPLVVRIPRLTDAHLALGRLYAGPLDDPARARTHLNAFLRQAPQHPQAEAVRKLLAGLPAAP
jgi:regulator of sirC expression with transglutaminase-like and TPR domain